jgi:hypothetical protein
MSYDPELVREGSSVASKPHTGLGGKAKLVLALFMLFMSFAMWVFSGFGTYVGVRGIIRQNEALSTWESVQADVVGSDCSPTRDSSTLHGLPVGRVFDWVFGPSYGVAVSYRYTVDGKQYQSGSEKGPKLDLIGSHGRATQAYLGHPDWSWSGRVQALDSSVAYGREEWAKATAALYVKGKPCQAYYDPANPSEAFLLHEYDFMPYMITMICATIFTAGLIVLTRAYLQWRHGKPEHVPRRTALRAKAWSHFCALLLFGGCALALSHFFSVSEHPQSRSIKPLVFSIVVGFLFCIYLLIVRDRVINKPLLTRVTNGEP